VPGNILGYLQQFTILLYYLRNEVLFPTICDVTLALLTEFADKPADVLLLRLPILWGVTLALLTEFADKPADVLLLRLPILWGVTLALLTGFADKPFDTCAET
jgi:putative NIF3 family GTP cyclohydrolase 1 type 2